MSRPTSGPFEQRRLSRRERKAAERRAQARAAARAQAMPPPDPQTRVTHSGSAPVSAPQVDASAGAARRSLRQVSAQAPGPVPTQPSPPTAPVQAPVVAWPQAPATEVSPTPAEPYWVRLSQQWTGQHVPWTFSAAVTAVLVSAAAALGWGAPVLGHDTSWPVLAAAAGALALGVATASRAWGHTPRRTRRVACGVGVVLLAAFSLGVLTNPVVVDGKVFLATSTEAHEYRMMRQAYADLTRLHALDRLLTYDAASAGAHFNEYQPAQDELAAMATKYASYQPADLPDPRFAETVSDLKSAAYWADQAMTAKMQLNSQADAKLADDVVTDRANFVRAAYDADHALSFLSADLNIPLNTWEHE